jgi:hypothetical protein
MRIIAVAGEMVKHSVVDSGAVTIDATTSGSH